MAEILLLNPRRKTHRRRMPAGLARYWRSHRRGRHHSRARAVNPRRRAHRRHYRNPRRYRRYAAHYRRRRRNPRNGQTTAVIREFIVPALIGGVGAVGMNIVWGALEPNLPASLQSGWAASITEAATVLLAAWALGKAIPDERHAIGVAAVGALTVIGYTVLMGIAPQILPAGTPGLSAYMLAGPTRYPLRGLAGPGLRAYMPRTMAGLGDLYSPAPVIQSGNFPQFEGDGAVNYGTVPCAGFSNDGSD